MTGIITKLCKDDDGCVEVTTDNRKWLNWMKAVIPILSDGTRSDQGERCTCKVRKQFYMQCRHEICETQGIFPWTSLDEGTSSTRTFIV